MILASHGLIASSILQVDADWLAYYNRVIAAGGSLTTTEQNATKQLVADLKANSLWTPMKAIYPMVGASAAACAQNLKSSSFTGTFNGGVTYSSTGIKLNGTSGYLNTNFNFSNCALNSIHRSIYVQETYNTLGTDPSTTSGLPSSFIGSYANGQWAANDGFSGSGTSRATKGLEIVYRNTSTTIKRLRSTFIDSATVTSTFLVNANAVVGCYNNNNAAFSAFTSYTFSFASMGDGLTDTDAANLNTIVQAFQTTLSRNV